jgi:hypothetical protein
MYCGNTLSMHVCWSLGLLKSWCSAHAAAGRASAAAHSHIKQPAALSAVLPTAACTELPQLVSLVHGMQHRQPKHTGACSLWRLLCCSQNTRVYTIDAEYC